MNAGADAGTLLATDELAETVLGDKGVTYVRHTKAGAERRQPETRPHKVAWTAPEMPGIPLVLHVSLSPTGDAAQKGDVVYTASAAL